MGTRRLSAGVVVLRRDKESAQLYLLLLRAYQYWDFPKGMQEIGETELETALREVQEETTISELDFEWGEVFFETGPYRGGKVARYYIATAEQIDIELPINPELGCPEHVESDWVTFEQAIKMCSPRVISVINWAQKVINGKDL